MASAEAALRPGWSAGGALAQVQALQSGGGFTPSVLCALSTETQLILLLFVKRVTHRIKMANTNPTR